MFWSQPKPCANIIAVDPVPRTCTLFRSIADITGLRADVTKRGDRRVYGEGRPHASPFAARESPLGMLSQVTNPIRLHRRSVRLMTQKATRIRVEPRSGIASSMPLRGVATTLLVTWAALATQTTGKARRVWRSSAHRELMNARLQRVAGELEDRESNRQVEPARPRASRIEVEHAVDSLDLRLM